MRKLVSIFFVALLISSVTFSAFASGDKNRGDEGKGSVVQVQERKTENGTPAF